MNEMFIINKQSVSNNERFTKIVYKKNLIILKDLSSKNETYIREISENTGVSPAQVHQAIKIFKQLCFIKEKKLKNKKSFP